MTDISRPIRVALALVALLVALPVVTAAEAQTALDAEWSQQFVGSWRLSLDTPDGAMPVTVKIAQGEDGVAAQVGFPDPEDEMIEDVTRVGDALLLRFTVPFEGNDLAIAMRLTRDDEALQTRWDVANGEFQLDARATRE